MRQFKEIVAFYDPDQMAFPSELSFAESLKREPRLYFYERNQRTAIAMLLFIFLAPLIGVYLRGFSGVVWGVVLSVGAYYLAPYIVLKFR